MSELKPCPFCNNDMSSNVTDDIDGFGKCCRLLSVCCDCGVTGPFGKDIESAIDLWNTRATNELLNKDKTMKAKPILIKAGDRTVLINGHSPKVDCRVVAEDFYTSMTQEIATLTARVEELEAVNNELQECLDINRNIARQLFQDKIKLSAANITKGVDNE